VFNPYYAADNTAPNRLGRFNRGGNSATASWLQTCKEEIDLYEFNHFDRPPLAPINNLSSIIHDGYLYGTMQFRLQHAAHPTENRTIIYNVILVEAFHRYGTEEHWFIPRAAASLNGITANDRQILGQTTTFPYKFPLDRS
jgi:hypothetical protein